MYPVLYLVLSNEFSVVTHLLKIWMTCHLQTLAFDYQSLKQKICILYQSSRRVILFFSKSVVLIAVLLGRGGGDKNNEHNMGLVKADAL